MKNTVNEKHMFIVNQKLKKKTFNKFHNNYDHNLLKAN